MTLRRRPIKANNRSYTGFITDLPGGRDIPFESGGERDFYTLLKLRRDVVDVIAQPFTLEFEDDCGRHRRYTPDALIHYQTRSGLYEVKQRSDLRENWMTLAPGFKEARRWARGQSRPTNFRIITERFLNRPRLENAKLIGSFKAHPIDPAIETAILAVLSDGPSSIKALVQALETDGHPRLVIWSNLWSAIAQWRIQADLDKPLGMQAVIWAPNNE